MEGVLSCRQHEKYAEPLTPSQTMSRNGKIARLPRNLREEANFKLDNNVQGEEIFAWPGGRTAGNKEALEGHSTASHTQSK